MSGHGRPRRSRSRAACLDHPPRAACRKAGGPLSSGGAARRSSRPSQPEEAGLAMLDRLLETRRTHRKAPLAVTVHRARRGLPHPGRAAGSARRPGGAGHRLESRADRPDRPGGHGDPSPRIGLPPRRRRLRDGGHGAPVAVRGAGGRGGDRLRDAERPGGAGCDAGGGAAGGGGRAPRARAAGPPLGRQAHGRRPRRGRRRRERDRAGPAPDARGRPRSRARGGRLRDERAGHGDQHRRGGPGQSPELARLAREPPRGARSGTPRRRPRDERVDLRCSCGRRRGTW